MKLTICLYEGSVVSINRIIATKVIDAYSMERTDYLSLFYDKVEQKVPTDYPLYKNRITGKVFTSYYEREIMISDKVHTIDFGSHSRFIGVFEGEHNELELNDILQKTRQVMCL